MPLNTAKLAARVERARYPLTQRVRYKLGKGGFKPSSATPAPDWLCDCSGFVSWAIGISRFQGNKRKPWSAHIPWIETTAIVQDATGLKRLFKEIEAPVPGCLVVYGDSGKRQGHVGIVSVVRSAKDYDVIDCNASIARRLTGRAIGESSRHAFRGNPRAIFVVLSEDFEAA